MIDISIPGHECISRLTKSVPPSDPVLPKSSRHKPSQSTADTREEGALDGSRHSLADVPALARERHRVLVVVAAASVTAEGSRIGLVVGIKAV